MLMFLLGLILIQLMVVSANPCAGIVGPTYIQAGTCDTYYICQNSVATKGRCPDGYLFDFEVQACNWNDFVNCIDYCIGVPNSRFVARTSAGCGAYYICQNGIGIPRNCPDNLRFDYEQQACDEPENVDCDPNPPTAPTAPPTAPTVSTTTATTTTTTTTTTTKTTTTTTTLAPGPCLGYVNSTFIFYPPNGCGGWQLCRNNVSVYRGTCDDGLYFNSAKQFCDDPKNVKCLI